MYLKSFTVLLIIKAIFSMTREMIETFFVQVKLVKCCGTKITPDILPHYIRKYSRTLKLMEMSLNNFLLIIERKCQLCEI